jgi:hypothetical protein
VLVVRVDPPAPGEYVFIHLNPREADHACLLDNHPMAEVDWLVMVG